MKYYWTVFMKIYVIHLYLLKVHQDMVPNEHVST